jgi:4-coumarate--CoA ligase
MVARVLSLSTLNRVSRFASCVQQKKLCSFGLRGLSTCTRLQAVVDHSQPTGVVIPGEEGFIVKSRWSDVKIPEMNLADFVWEDIEHNAANTALVCGMTGRSYSFAMAHGLSRKFGSALLRMGAKRGDVIGLVLPNIPEFPIVFMGTVGVNMTVTTMNPTYRPEEIARQMENSGARFIVTIGMFVENIKQSCDIYTGVEKIIVIGDPATVPEDCTSFLDLVMNEDGSLYGQDKSCNAMEDVAALPYSSGTTGPPKGVCLSHYNLIANLCQSAHPDCLPLRPFKETGVQESTLAVLPFFHIYAMELVMLFNLRSGAKSITLPKFEPESYIKALDTYKPTFLNLVPPLVSFLATNPAVKPSLLNSVTFVTGGAAPFGPALIEKFMEKVLPHKMEFREGFGMTESSPMTHVQPEKDAVLGACGSPISNTWAKIVDTETGEILGEEQQGELCVSGPQVMKGYYKNSSATNSTVVNGWLMTGDIAKYDASGQFTIVDRLKELIKVKGLQVAPSELEDLMRRHSGVLDVAVVGVPDERAGELPRAYVIRKNRNVTEQSIIDYVAERVAPHKKLGAGVMFVETLPKNQTGKILRRELKAQVFKGSFGY